MSTAWFTKALLPWYREHKRPLPWRESHDPYRIWLSEVILQQTRVEQGRAYWHHFVDTYPTAAHLAAATEDQVLRSWQGLGYYSRARNLRTAAQQVVREHGGRFPTTYAELKALKGVGEYTAAAIGSIAFGLPEPVVDGNVYRVLARVFGIDTPIDSTAGRKEFRALAATLLDHKHPGEHNQAVMELGALVCTPQRPACTECPLARRCAARATDRIGSLPVKAGKTKVRVRYFNYLHVQVGKALYLHQRTGKDIWQGLYELPLLETHDPADHSTMAALVTAQLGKGWVVSSPTGPVKHVLSHQVLQAVFWRAEPPKGFRPPGTWVRVNADGLAHYALPRLLERYLLDPSAG